MQILISYRQRTKMVSDLQINGHVIVYDAGTLLETLIKNILVIIIRHSWDLFVDRDDACQFFGIVNGEIYRHGRPVNIAVPALVGCDFANYVKSVVQSDFVGEPCTVEKCAVDDFSISKPQTIRRRSTVHHFDVNDFAANMVQFFVLPEYTGSGKLCSVNIFPGKSVQNIFHAEKTSFVQLVYFLRRKI